MNVIFVIDIIYGQKKIGQVVKLALFLIIKYYLLETEVFCIAAAQIIRPKAILFKKSAAL